MKHILTTTLLAATVFLAQADDRTIPEKIREATGNVIDKTKEAAIDTKEAITGAAHGVARATRTGWTKTKAFFSEDMPVYHEGAQATLAALAKEIGGMKAGATSAPTYFRTRLAALDEQRELLTRLLAQLSRDGAKDRSSVPFREFDRCLADLEQAVDQAENGADAVPRDVLK